MSHLDSDCVKITRYFFFRNLFIAIVSLGGVRFVLSVVVVGLFGSRIDHSIVLNQTTCVVHQLIEQQRLIGVSNLSFYSQHKKPNKNSRNRF